MSMINRDRTVRMLPGCHRSRYFRGLQAGLIWAFAQVRTGALPGTRTSNPRIKSLSGAGSPGFMRVRAAAQAPRAYPGELGRIAVNCNPNCNPRCLDLIGWARCSFGYPAPFNFLPRMKSAYSTTSGVPSHDSSAAHCSARQTYLT
jgi:hypothetical protein